MTAPAPRFPEAALKSKAQTVKKVCDALLAGDAATAAGEARTNYPFIRPEPKKRTYNKRQAIRIFLRDGFIDRYSGAPVIFPGALFLLSRLLPAEFPSHPHWKMTETHMAYWEFYPELDHIVPIARGGANDESNLATTSVLRNCLKANWTLEELEWSLKPRGKLEEWDGLLGWFMEYCSKHTGLLMDRALKLWHDAAKEAVPEAERHSRC